MSALRVLNIDDETDIREVVAISLGLDPDFVVRGCASGEAGLRDAAEFPPDLILLDVMMPVMDGPATLGHLRGNAQTAGIPVVFMTARAQTRELEHFKSLGAIGVIAKPFDPMTLAAAVRSHIRLPDDGLAEARSVFLRRLSDDATSFVACRLALRSPTDLAATLTRIRGIAHGLAGAGGIFGFREISSRATILEEAVIVTENGTKTGVGVENALEGVLASIETSSSWRREPADRRLDA
jgi:DNA-binding response OmpR family regulator